MKKNSVIKKLFCLLTVTVLLMSSFGMVSANNSGNNGVDNSIGSGLKIGTDDSTGEIIETGEGYLKITISEEEQNKDLEQQIVEEMEQFLLAQKLSRTPGYVNLTHKVVETKYPFAKGYAGGQPLKGERFKTGGSFFWAPGKGPSVNLSASFAGIGASINLGHSASVGRVVNVPNNKDFFKLHVKETHRVQKIAVYGRPMINPSLPAQFLYYSYNRTLYSREFSAIKQ